MYIRFELAKPGDETNTAFRYLRVGLLRLHFERWAEQHNIRDFRFIAHEGNARIQFRHASEYTMFGLAWDNYNGYSYSIVADEKNPVLPKKFRREKI